MTGREVRSALGGSKRAATSGICTPSGRWNPTEAAARGICTRAAEATQGAVHCSHSPRCVVLWQRGFESRSADGAPAAPAEMVAARFCSSVTDALAASRLCCLQRGSRSDELWVKGSKAQGREGGQRNQEVAGSSPGGFTAPPRRRRSRPALPPTVAPKQRPATATGARRRRRVGAVGCQAKP